MSWMITDQGELDGTCYIEVLPGRFHGACWNRQSVFFTEEHFGFIERTIVRNCPEYSHYAFTDISRPRWEAILADLDRLHSKIGSSSRLADFRNDIDLFFADAEQRFLQSESENVKSLRQMLNEFVRWARKTLETHDSIAVLGI